MWLVTGLVLASVTFYASLRRGLTFGHNDFEDLPPEVAEAWLSDREILLAAFNNNTSNKKYRRRRRHNCELELVSQELRNDTQIVVAAVTRCGRNLEFASENLQADQTVVLAAVTADVSAIKFAAESLRGDPSFMLAVLEAEAASYEEEEENALKCMKHATKTLRADRGFVLAAARVTCTG